MKKKRILSLLLAATLTFSSMPMVLAKEGVKPSDQTTKEQPFWAGTGESDKFRIPCLVSLDDGTLVAGCDARWTTHMDGGGLDTIVSYSKDKGKTWNYTFANYLGDNGNEHNVNSTAFIDPAMATDGKKVYMIADLYPAGYALNGAKKSPLAGKSHDDKGNILLADARGWNDVWCGERTKPENYTYRLVKNTKENKNDAYFIQDKDGKTVEGYTVDAYFNVKGKDVNANLFEAGSPFQVWPTDYLYLTTSENGGKTWSVPSILNLRKDNEQSLLVGPGRGMVTSKGRIVFTAYEFTGGDKNSTAIYSDDGGKTWKRGKSVSRQSSEAVITEADGKLYMFTRHGGYYVSTDWGENWSERKNMGITYNLSCQLTAITYPKKIDGKTAILFAAPSNTGSRAAGKIFVALVQEDGTLKWTYEYSVNGSEYYAYSCLAVLPDGTVGLLYENGWTEITYTSLDIEEIVKGGVVGNIWCTDETGKGVSSVTMKSNVTKTFTVNGVKENAEVTVDSDNPLAVKGVYEKGKLTVTSQKVKGLEQAVVTVKSGEASTKIRVNVTDSEHYEIVNLRVGDTKTYTDKTGNYSDDTLESLNKNIADITLEGENAKEVENVSKAKLATANGKFDGQETILDSCLFTFQSVNGKTNTYTVSAKSGETTVYLSHKNAPSKCACTTTSANIQLEQKENETFALADTSAGNNGKYLYFWKGDTSKLHFDRNSSADNNCTFELYKKVEKEQSDIPGYKKVTKLSEIASGERYLIASKATDGTNYVLHPSNTTSSFNHVAKVVKQQIEMKPEAEIQLGTNAQFSGEKKKISSSLFTFDKKDNGKFVISAITEKGEKVYLTPKTATSANTPFTKTGADLTVTKENDGVFSFKQDGEGHSGGYLYFHKEAGKLYFDRNGSTHDNCKFSIYKASQTAKDSEILGYVKVKDVSEIENNGQYLIGVKAADGKNYLLNPSQETEKYAYVAKVTGNLYEGQSEKAKTTITITGKAEGKTEETIGKTTYYIIVKNEKEEITLKVGETYKISGKVVQVKGDANSIKTKENNGVAPYKAIDKLEEGTYLFGNSTHIMLNTSSTEGNPTGLGMKRANLHTGTYAESSWTIAKAENGYTMKDVNGKYINIDNQNVTLKDTPQVLTIVKRNQGGFAVSNNGKYLNNWAQANNKVAAYASDDNAWNFYTASAGTEVTAVNVGKVELITNGITYSIQIVDEPSICQHSWGKWTVVVEPSCTKEGKEVRVCEKCGLEEKRVVKPNKHTEKLVNKKAPTCAEEGYTGDLVCAVCGEMLQKGKTIEKAEHSFENAKWEIIKQPTYTENGEKTRICEVCGAKETQIIPMLEKVESNTGNNHSDKVTTQPKDPVQKNNTAGVKTGDHAPITMLLMLVLGAVGTFGGTIVYKRKKK
ncbi:sialidase family protein [Faecalimonas sp.]